MDAIVYDKVGKEAEKVRNMLYGIYPQSTITDAAIASFDDGADDIPVKSLTVGIEPVQDLHGYDSPWPGGSRKNLIPYPYASPSQTSRGITFTVNTDSTVSVSGTAVGGSSYFYFWSYESSSTPFPSWIHAGETYTISGGINSLKIQVIFYGDPSVIYNTSGTASYTFTAPADLSAYTGFAIVIQVQEGSSPSGIVKPMLELGSSASPFEPYSNICPITGFDSVKVTRTGKNLFDMSNVLDNAWINTAHTNISTSEGANIFYADVPKNTTVTYTADNGNRCVIAGFKKRPTTIIGSTYDAIFYSSPAQLLTYTFDTGDCEFVAFYLNRDQANKPTWIQLELGSTATAYEPYQGNTYDITLPTAAGTVYGGTLNTATGKLVVDRAMKNVQMSIGSYNLSINALIIFSSYGIFSDASAPANNNTPFSAIADAININNASAINSGEYGIGLTTSKDVYLKTVGASSKNDYLSIFPNGINVVYELATPITYTLTAEQVTTLLGLNNVWADTGNIEKLTYRADLGKYIDSHITTAVANVLNA